MIVSLGAGGGGGEVVEDDSKSAFEEVAGREFVPELLLTTEGEAREVEVEADEEATTGEDLAKNEVEFCVGVEEAADEDLWAEEEFLPFNLSSVSSDLEECLEETAFLEGVIAAGEEDLTLSVDDEDDASDFLPFSSFIFLSLGMLLLLPASRLFPSFPETF